jgi:hypothetical protein
VVEEDAVLFLSIPLPSVVDLFFSLYFPLSLVRASLDYDFTITAFLTSSMLVVAG